MEERPNNKKRILIFSTAYLPMLGGAEVAVKEIAARLAGDFEFDLICARIKKELPSEEKIGNVAVWRMGRGWNKLDKFLLPWQGFKRARRLHDQKKYDAIWAIMASFGGLCALFFKEQFSGVPYVLTLQEGDATQHIYSRAKWLGSYYGKIFREADYITVISQYLKVFARKQGAKAPVAVVPNGVDLGLFLKEYPAQELEALKQKLGKKPQDRYIIHTGRLVPKNSLDSVIRALVYLPDSVKFLALGEGSELYKLKNLARELKVSDRVKFLGEFGHRELAQYLKISDVFARPSLSEGLGNSFLEAMAAGLPVIGTKVGGIPDFLRDPSNAFGAGPATGSGQATGLFCQVRDPLDLAQKVEMILGDAALREKLARNGQALVKENYSWDIVVPKMKKIFDCVISKIC